MVEILISSVTKSFEKKAKPSEEIWFFERFLKEKKISKEREIRTTNDFFDGVTIG